MKAIRKNLLREGSRVEDAMDIFRATIESNNLDKHTIQGWGPVYLTYLTDPEGWLGVWMLKSDELAAQLLKCRLWDSVYVKDSNSVQTIKPINRGEMDQDGPEFDAYDRFPLASDIGVPMSLRYMVANMAFKESLIVMGKEVSITPVKGFYDISKELEEGEVLPFHDPERLTAYYLNKHIFEINNSPAMMDLSLSEDHEI